MSSWKDFWLRKDVTTSRANMAYNRKLLKANPTSEKHLNKFWKWQAIYLEKWYAHIEGRPIKPKHQPTSKRQPTPKRIKMPPPPKMVKTMIEPDKPTWTFQELCWD